jgi:hypothetical protein
LKTSYIADPLAVGAYPITGTANALLYTCYKTPNIYKVLNGFFSWYYQTTLINGTTTGLLNEAGVSPLPASWRSAIRQTFFTATLSGLNLQINQKGKGACTASSITGG